MLSGKGSLCGCAMRLQALQDGSALRPGGVGESASSSSRSLRLFSSESKSQRCLPTSTIRLRPQGSPKRKRLSTAAPSSDDGHVHVSRSPESPLVDVPVTQTDVPSVAVKPPKRDQLNDLMFHPTLFAPVRKPRHPIVLCHGLYGFDVRGPAGSAYQLHYWGAILEILRGVVGAEVIVSRVPGTGSVEGRAKALDAVLRKEVAGRDINLLAHSMGGLDARYLISNIKPDAYNVLSLTTVSTPHRGSPFMEWCSSTMGLGRDGERAGETARSTLAHWMGMSLAQYFAALFDSPAYRDLLPEYLEKRFNPAVPNSSAVRYFSVAARTGSLGIWHPLYWPKTVLDAAEAKAAEEGRALAPELRGNDGLVAVQSAQWGEFLGVVDNCDHWRIRGSSGFRISAAPKRDADDVVALPPSSRLQGKQVVEAAAAAGSASGRPRADSNGASAVASSETLLKATEGRAWSWEDVNTIIDPLKALVSPLNRLLSVVPALVGVTPARQSLSATSPTTHYITPSLAFSAAPSPESGAGSASTPSLSASLPLRGDLMSPTTRFIHPSEVFSPPSASPAPLRSSSTSAGTGGGLLSYFRRAPSNAPSPTTRYVQLSLGFSPRRDAAPGLFRAVPNLSTLLAPPAFLGLSAQKSVTRRDAAAAEAGAKDAFDLERLYVALARKLHDEGL